MRTTTFLLTLFIATVMGFSQTSALDEAKLHLKEMDDVVHFTTMQKQEILEIFKLYVEGDRALNHQDYSQKKEYLIARIQLYKEARKSIYQLCTKEQLQTYRAFKEQQQAAILALLVNIDYEKEYNASKQ